MNKRLILYVHGQGGCAEEASVYEPLFPDCAVKGMVYTATSPWEAREEFPAVFDCMCSDSERITLIANSIGAYFSMEALPQSKLEKAYFISPIVHMEKLIETMMGWANVTEKELQKRKRIETDFGQTLSWEYHAWKTDKALLMRILGYPLYASPSVSQFIEGIALYTMQRI